MLARPTLPSFNYVKPTSTDEAVGMLKEFGTDARLFLGGTDLFNRMHASVVSPKLLIDLKGLPGIREIAFNGTDGLTVGAGVNMNRIASHPDVQKDYEVLAEAATSVASYQLRNRATIGGNLCNASPCADIAPATLVLEGCMVVYGPNGVRSVSAHEFHKGPGKTDLDPCEILTAIKYPLSPAGSVGRYYKLGRNKYGDLAVISAAILAYPNKSANSGFSFRIALGSVGPVAFRASKAERFLEENPSGEATFARAAELAREASSPISDVRAGAEYQREMVEVHTFNLLKEVFRRLEHNTRSSPVKGNS